MVHGNDDATFTPIPPPKSRRKKYEVLRPQPNSPAKGFCLHQELIPVLTHWHPNASGKVRHLDGNCPWCEFFDPEDIRWYGYMPALFELTGKIVALEVSHQAALDCAALSTARLPLRGKLMKLIRYGATTHGRCGCVIEETYRNRDLPPGIDASDFLDAIFHKAECVPAIGGAAKWKGEV